MIPTIRGETPLAGCATQDRRDLLFASAGPTRLRSDPRERPTEQQRPREQHAHPWEKQWREMYPALQRAASRLNHPAIAKVACRPSHAPGPATRRAGLHFTDRMHLYPPSSKGVRLRTRPQAFRFGYEGPEHMKLPVLWVEQDNLPRPLFAELDLTNSATGGNASHSPARVVANNEIGPPADSRASATRVPILKHLFCLWRLASPRQGSGLTGLESAMEHNCPRVPWP